MLLHIPNVRERLDIEKYLNVRDYFYNNHGGDYLRITVRFCYFLGLMIDVVLSDFGSLIGSVVKKNETDI